MKNSVLAGFHAVGARLRTAPETISVVYADPSRRGLGYHPAKALAALKGPVRLALIYCSLKPVAKELHTLIGAGYVLKEVEGIDLFPHTLHVETLCLLEKRG